MARLGTEKRPAIVRVQTEERMQEIASLFEKHGWIFIIGLEPDKPENITDLERLLYPSHFQLTATKTGRNEPCPCGSGKKYKKCCLRKQEYKENDNIDVLMQEGYSLLEKNKTVEACEIWMEAWNRLKSRFSPYMISISDADTIFDGTQSLFNWSQDLEMELGNAALKKNSFYKKRIEYCQEFITFFPGMDSLILHNMKRAIAESYFGMGDPAKGDDAFVKLIEEYPENIWGYIGWGDMYFIPLNDNDKSNYQRAEHIYGMVLPKNLEDKDALLERLEDLKKEKKKSPDR